MVFIRWKKENVFHLTKNKREIIMEIKWDGIPNEFFIQNSLIFNYLINVMLKTSYKNKNICTVVIRSCPQFLELNVD